MQTFASTFRVSLFEMVSLLVAHTHAHSLTRAQTHTQIPAHGLSRTRMCSYTDAHEQTRNANTHAYKSHLEDVSVRSADKEAISVEKSDLIPW